MHPEGSHPALSPARVLTGGDDDALLATGADVCEGVYSATGGGGGETSHGGRDGGPTGV